MLETASGKGEEDDVQGVVVRVRGDEGNANIADDEDGF